MRTMATSAGTVAGQRSTEQTAKVVTTGSSLEAICGAGAAVLAILGLCHIMPVLFTAIAAIAAGAALVFEGGAVASRFRDLERKVAGDSAGEVELAGGTSMEIIGGAGAVVLGILALVGIYPALFAAIAAIAVGGALLFGSGATSRLDMLAVGTSEMNLASRHAAHESIMGAAGLQTLAGVAGVALGILAVIGISTALLTLIAFVSVGGAILLSGSAIVTRMAMLLGG